MTYSNFRFISNSLPISFSKFSFPTKLEMNFQSRRFMEQFIMGLKSLLKNKSKEFVAKRLNQQSSTSMMEFDKTSLLTNLKNSDKVLKIAVEGNIGSGKTTFLSIFNQYAKKMSKNPMILPEPVDQWRNVKGVNILQLLTDDPIRWSFTFQLYVQFTMLQVYKYNILCFFC